MVRTSAIQELLRKLGNPRTQATAKAELRRMGGKIFSELHEFVESTADEAARMKALALVVDMTDSRSLPLFWRLLSSPIPAVRSFAAQGLYKQNSPDAAAALVQTINDNPDMLRRESTPSVAALMDMGLESLPHILPLLDAHGRDTRLRAQTVLMRVTYDHVKNSMGEKAVKSDVDRTWNDLWRKNGDYHIDLPVDRRQRAIAAWAHWVKSKRRT